jgi:tRNA threonylcarbamoyladenosine biosynthesis protein TsaE
VSGTTGLRGLLRSETVTRDQLVAWGEQLGAVLSPPAIVTLAGDLGAGKTTLVQAICRGYGVQEPVTSPTFALVHTYEAPRSSVHHLDLYRLKGPGELQNIGWDDLQADHALVLIEWPERAGDWLPSDCIRVTLGHVPGAPDQRQLSVEAR